MLFHAVESVVKWFEKFSSNQKYRGQIEVGSLADQLFALYLLVAALPPLLILILWRKLCSKK